MAEKKEPMVKFYKKGRITVGAIHSSSVLSMLNVTEFGKTVLKYLATHPGINLLLDFEEVSYLSSAVLNELLRINKAIQESQGNLRLCGISPTIKEIFTITNLDQIFNIHGEPIDKDIVRYERALAVAQEAEAWEDVTEE
jgi:anti-sigma B factor antagonist